MPRCPDCAKFVSLEQGEPEVNELTLDDGMITATVRIANCCAECGTEVTEADLEWEAELEGDVSGHEGDGHALKIDEADCAPTMRTEGKGRGTKTFYGAEISYSVTCSCGKLGEITGSLNDDVQASDMENLG